MNQKTLRVLAISGCFAVLMASAVPQARAQSGHRDAATIRAARSDSGEKTRVTVRPTLAFSDHAVLHGGGSVLVRTKDGVYMSIHAFGLTPGDAVTAWFVFFNNPDKCATRPCTPADLENEEVQGSLVNATGRVVGPDGTADFGAFRAVGDTVGAQLGPGLLSPFKAEIHIAVRAHGPALLGDPRALSEQLTTFNGGCPPNTCGNLQVSIHEP
jgi:hypothetical protein